MLFRPYPYRSDDPKLVLAKTAAFGILYDTARISLTSHRSEPVTDEDVRGLAMAGWSLSHGFATLAFDRQPLRATRDRHRRAGRANRTGCHRIRGTRETGHRLSRPSSRVDAQASRNRRDKTSHPKMPRKRGSAYLTSASKPCGMGHYCSDAGASIRVTLRSRSRLTLARAPSSDRPRG